FCTIYFRLLDAPSTHIYSLSLHDALPIFELDLQRVVIRSALIGREVCVRSAGRRVHLEEVRWVAGGGEPRHERGVARDAAGQRRDRKSTRLNSSHQIISYAVFCLKKKKHQ